MTAAPALPRRDAAEQARLAAGLTDLIEHRITFNQVLGLRVQQLLPQRLLRFDLRVDFLRPGLGQHFIASAELTRLGGRVGSTQMRLHNDAGDLIATAAAACIVS